MIHHPARARCYLESAYLTVLDVAETSVTGSRCPEQQDERGVAIGREEVAEILVKEEVVDERSPRPYRCSGRSR